MSEANATTGPPRAYAQWVTMVLKNSGSQDIKVKNMNVSWGKLYADGNKDNEISPSTYNDYVVHPGEEVRINGCGRENASSGTTGEFDVLDPTASNKVIRHFYWDCPWGSKANTWTVSNINSKWMVESSGANLDSGALGTITVEFLNKPGK
ncbi:Aegerolysin aa-Pri1 [Lentinus tigrinus ALCF2SS1-6]|uniref:Aegerolysin aa-Pri1 n=1 Tax=Lentinus tigrinus ALCF2SS1-6 TaxID=1328759 RepID=A0A5C2RTH7_9APHY|nr:Aegerolysin aa-Pri1 [Lentinus tigrinus ALCF2SS1-6]